MIDELDISDLFDVKTDEEIKDFDDTASHKPANIEAKVRDLEALLRLKGLSDKEIQIVTDAKKEQLSQARQKRKEYSIELYEHIIKLKNNGKARKEILNKTYKNKKGQRVKISKKHYENAMKYEKHKGGQEYA